MILIAGWITPRPPLLGKAVIGRLIASHSALPGFV